jgi:hypothetical protein
MKTNPKRRPATETSIMAFWDTSGLVPLCCLQSASAQARQAGRIYAQQVVWWATPVEAVSALNRLIRESVLSGKDGQQAFAKLEYLRRRWDIVPPADEVRDLAEGLLKAHRLRAADALQLGAALFWCSGHPRGRCFIGADGLLLDAAEAEGFTVIRLK